MTSNARELAQIPSTPTGRRNIVINGAMQVAQRSTSATGVGASAGYFAIDRFRVSPTSTAGRLTMSQDTDAPSGFGAAMKLDCTTADTSVAAGEAFILITEFEGQDVQRLAKGTSSAKEVTLSFYAKANAAKTYVVELKDIDNTRTCSKAFTVGTSYTRHEITFPADTTGVLDNDNAKSLAIHFWLHAGTDFTSGTLQTAWGSQTSANRAVGIDSFFSSTDNTFFITGIQLEVGSVATEFEHRSFGEEMMLCKRYYHRLERNDSANDSAIARGVAAIRICIAQTQSTTRANGILEFPVAMRAMPTLEVSAVGDIDYAVTTSTPAATGFTIDSSISVQNAFLRFDESGGSLTVGQAARIQINAAGKHIAFDAEL